MSTPSTPSAESAAAEAVGYYSAEYVRYARYEPPHDALPRVSFAYVPLTPNAQQEVLGRFERATGAERVRLSVRFVVERMRAWNLRRPDRSTADCRSAAEVSARVDANIVDGIARLILDSAATEGAEADLADFTRP